MSKINKWSHYSKINAYIIPDWLQKSILEITDKYGDKITKFYVNLYSKYYYDDNSSYDLQGDIGIDWKGYDDRPTEDELDHIPGMRRMERRAEDMWDHLPADSCQEEAGLSGEMTFEIKPDEIEFFYSASEYGGDGPDFGATAKWDGNQWTYEEFIILQNFNISETARTIGNIEEIISQINPTIAQIDAWPDPSILTFEFDKNDCLHIKANGGGFFIRYGRIVA